MKIIPFFLLIPILFFSGFTLGLAAETEDFARLRNQMVTHQIIARGVADPGVIKAMRKVKRHLFVPKRYQAYSYDDHPLPIGEGQTISQPYIVAFMTEALGLSPRDRVLEIGTGSGYQAAILAELVDKVYTIEIVKILAKRATQTLEKQGYKNIAVKEGDGYKGWPEKAPFDAIIVTCAPENIPGPLVQQLKEGGRMIIPVGKAGSIQRLVTLTKKDGKIKKHGEMFVRFVPMVKGGE
jgi:protein-L-isoaspartate(D-aspartate) O-methyltransferase